MQELILLQDMAIVMVVSAITMVLCHILRLPVVLGYILAGLLIGPHTPPYALITDVHSIHILSALGVIFLLFSIGLEFSLSKLAKVGAVAFIASTIEILLMIWVGFSIGKMMGWRQMDSLFLGAVLSVSSTTIIAKILIDTKKVNEKYAQIILGILIVEDLWAIVIIALLSGVATTGELTFSEMSVSMIKVFIFIVGLLFLGFLTVPAILRYIERIQMAEMMVIVVLGLCLGASLLAAKAGFSIALGAFLMGAVIAETKQAHDIVFKIESIRNMFTAIFFVSVGLLIDPAVIVQYALPILVLTIVTIIGKVCSCSIVTFLTGHDYRTSWKVGLGLAQIGEFSFIIAQLGLDTNVTSSFLYPIAVAVSAITTISTPFLMHHSDSIISFVKRYAPKPIVTFADLYPSWIAKIRAQEDGEESTKRVLALEIVKRYLPRFLLYTMSNIAIFFVANRFKFRFPDMSSDLYWSIVSVVMLPFLIGFIAAFDSLIWHGIILKRIHSSADLERAKEAGSSLRNFIRLVTSLLSGLVFLLVTSVLVPVLPVTIFVMAFVIASAGFFWTSIRQIHRKIEQTVLSVFDVEKNQISTETVSAQEQLVAMIRADYPLDFQTQDVLLPFEECAVNQTIKELDLRYRTGTSIVGIFRGEEVIPNPSADIRLQPGDVLLLIGNDEQLKSAMKFLGEKMKQKRGTQ